MTHTWKTGAVAFCLLLSAQLVSPVRGEQLFEFEPYRQFLTADDLKHGAIQIRKMLNDRPEMAQPAPATNGPIWKWLSRQFAGANVGSRIYWAHDVSQAELDYPLPPNGIYSLCVPAHKRIPAKICVARFYEGRPLSYDELWSSTIFELFNIRNDSTFSLVNAKVQRKELSKEQYVKEIALAEHSAKLKTLHFYKTVWVDELGPASQPSLWYLEPDFEIWFSKFPRSADYPWNLYGAQFDRLTK